MRVTLKDISEATGYEVSTVSKVLRGDKRCYASEETRKIIFDAATQLDYVPNHFARSLRSNRSHTIGIVGAVAGAGATAPMLKAMTRELSATAYMPLFCASQNQRRGERRALRELRERCVDGIVLVTGTEDEELQRILPKNVPCVLIPRVEVPGRPSVVVDRTAAFAAGVRWLAERGHVRIAFMYADEEGAKGSLPGSTQLKMAGYRAAMEARGILDEGLLLPCGPSPADARESVLTRADLFKDVTAVLAANDRIAIEVMSGMAMLGLRVPEDCSVIGFDNVEFAEATHPRLTSFDPRGEEAGATAARMVLDLIDGKEVETVTIQPELTERESAGPCRKS